MLWSSPGLSWPYSGFPTQPEPVCSFPADPSPFQHLSRRPGGSTCVSAAQEIVAFLLLLNLRSKKQESAGAGLLFPYQMFKQGPELLGNSQPHFVFFCNCDQLQSYFPRLGRALGSAAVLQESLCCLQALTQLLPVHHTLK